MKEEQIETGDYEECVSIDSVICNPFVSTKLHLKSSFPLRYLDVLSPYSYNKYSSIIMRNNLMNVSHSIKFTSTSSSSTVSSSMLSVVTGCLLSVGYYELASKLIPVIANVLLLFRPH